MHIRQSYGIPFLYWATFILVLALNPFLDLAYSGHMFLIHLGSSVELAWIVVGLIIGITNKERESRKKSFSDIGIPILIGVFLLGYLAIKYMQCTAGNGGINFGQYKNYFLLLAVIVTVLVYPPDIRGLSVGVVISTALVSLIGYYSFGTSNYFGLTSSIIISVYRVSTHLSRALFIFSNPNVAAYYFLSIIPFLLYIHSKCTTRLCRRLYLCVMVLSVVSLLLTFSKSAILGLLGGVILSSALARLRLREKALLVAAEVLCLTVGYAIVSHFYWVFRWQFIFRNIRWEKWAVGWHSFAKYWVLGDPRGTSSDISVVNKFASANTFSDNQFLSLMIQFGLLGIGLCMLICYLLYTLAKLSIEAGGILRVALIIYFTSLLVGLVFNNFLDFHPDSLLCYVLLYALLRDSSMRGGASVTPSA